MPFINQPWEGTIGQVLTELLERDPRQFDDVYIAVAFVKSSGVNRLGPALARFRQLGGRVAVVAGFDEAGSSYEGLMVLSQFADGFRLFHNRNPRFSPTFHPKVYLFEAPTHAVVIVGSSNLTMGGLYTNYETVFISEFNRLIAEEEREYQMAKSGFEFAFTEGVPVTEELCNNLLEAGFIESERRVSRPSSGDREGAGPMPVSPEVLGGFPSMPIPPPPPSIGGPRSRGPGAGGGRVVAARPEQPPTARRIVGPGAYAQTLSTRDVGAKRGFSPDIFLSMLGRNQSPGFWGWPDEFSKNENDYDERYVTIWVNGEVVSSRLYVYENRGEFRLNCRVIHALAEVGDILVLERTEPGVGYDYIANVVKTGTREHQYWRGVCVNQAGNADKWWGYA